MYSLHTIHQPLLATGRLVAIVSLAAEHPRWLPIVAPLQVRSKLLLITADRTAAFADADACQSTAGAEGIAAARTDYD